MRVGKMNKKFLRRYLVIVVLVILLLTGCTREEATTKTEEVVAGQQRSTSDVKRLKIYTTGFSYIRDILGAYENRYHDVIVETIEIPEYDDYQQRLKKDLLVGHGPDVIIFESTTFPNIEKVAETDVFYDMNNYLLQDSESNLDEFNQPVLESGQFG